MRTLIPTGKKLKKPKQPQVPTPTQPTKTTRKCKPKTGKSLIKLQLKNLLKAYESLEKKGVPKAQLDKMRKECKADFKEQWVLAGLSKKQQDEYLKNKTKKGDKQ